MKLFPVPPIFWSSLLVLWASQSGTHASNPDICQENMEIDELNAQSSVEGNYIMKTAVEGNFLCALYPTNTLNCSWSFHTLQKNAQLFVYISVCDGERTVPPPSHNSSEERVGSRSLTLSDYQSFHVNINFHITLHDKWTDYTFRYDEHMLEVLAPPEKISASVKDGSLLVTWGLPHSREYSNPSCFEYQLDIGDQERPKNLTGQSYKEPNADPSRTYRVRIRARRKYECQLSPQWSDWSHTVMVEQSGYKLNTLVIISISLGIPMILLAVLLMVRHQRVTKVLFPPIPRPPPKYKCFLEKNDTLNFFHPGLSAEPEAEITEVEDTEQNPGKTF
ncbi:granulocyte-macrophage colony-stimulating factor receptor subunit alpha-like isoform X2 [Siniperca chuatsi]|nr:granulocyte-macrophage colony-stimulating factor receptor subunit alpha-like isoform X2 [Siniperca chuatsi]XP_044074956.1 granulocyte-macrophage colony-stimulating factor receptor subunit alpha-like isoform X2 [Siniperca chuatsi]XP_044074957.1 granulocyte-macrophage colony-stimulating factor receptor subunit alpha-like isoform X2 [Siniperca chuatsi]XP_044074958.1 granulocyte-macrophage colony-stimulating factor receptor subunit alpha-like isoform X2 [Siniperca chuatsi]XP_044074959.1 granuloc